MKSKSLLFRADGNSDVGLGHLYRLFSLVEMLKRYFEFTFITDEQSTIKIFPEDYKVHKKPKSVSYLEEPEWLFSNFEPDEYIIIADGYSFDSGYQKSLKDKGYSLIYIDDLVSFNMFADVVVNHSPRIMPSDYSKESYTKLALGTEYAMLRPSFIKQSKELRSISSIENVFVCFGGSDKYNLSFKAVSALLEFQQIKQVHVVLGAAYKHSNFKKFESNNKVRIYRNLSEQSLFEVMMCCHMAIAPASTILYEICSVKMPVLCGYYVNNQKKIYEGMVEKNAVSQAGDFREYTIEDFKGKIHMVLGQNYERQIRAQQKLFDGNAPRRFLALVNGLLVSLRKANEKDLMTVFDWSNDALVRKNSYASDPIELNDHKDWFKNQLNNSNALLLIGLVNNFPAAFIRYNLEDNKSKVGILISKSFRGQGLAPLFLESSAKLYFEIFEQPIWAYIKTENTASTQSFKRAGYSFLKHTNISGVDSVIYQLEKAT